MAKGGPFGFRVNKQCRVRMCRSCIPMLCDIELQFEKPNPYLERKPVRYRIRSILILALTCMLSVCLCIPAFADETASQVATSDEYGGREAITAEGMVAVAGEEVADGTYDILVETDTQMFNIVDCQLTVEDGKMNVVITLSSDGYQWVYMGTGEEAAAADSSEYIEYVEDENGRYTYDIGEVPSLNTVVKCCCFSKRRQQWYDHDIVFVAGTLPNDALSDKAQQAVRESNPLYSLEDGDYYIAVDVFGGEDTVEDPALMTLADDNATATLRFSSPNYEQIVMTGEAFEPVEVTADSATYEIPVRVFDTSIPVTFVSVASGAPEELAGSLSFHSGQMTDLSGGKVTAAGAQDAAVEGEADADNDDIVYAECGTETANATRPKETSVPILAIVVPIAAACVLVGFFAYKWKTAGKSDEGGE